MWRRRKSARQPARWRPGEDTGLGDECEAYLAGQLGTFLHDIGRSVPPVAWLNQVVHATPAELSLLAVERTDVIPLFTWRKALGLLARSLFERARETGRPVDELQRELLVPLELELLADPGAGDLEADEVVRLGLTRLYELPELPA